MVILFQMGMSLNLLQDMVMSAGFEIVTIMKSFLKILTLLIISFSFIQIEKDELSEYFW
jgi:hypothetical protein